MVEKLENGTGLVSNEAKNEFLSDIKVADG
jgi:hypothetical protein